MCTLYKQDANLSQLIDAFDADVSELGNLQPTEGIFPDRVAPIVRAGAEGRSLSMARWGFPPPPNVKGREVVNVRNLASGYWRPYLKAEQRCLVPATAFSEWTADAPKKLVWFDAPTAPIFAFAGIWRMWQGTRGTKKYPVEGLHTLFSFLTCEPNGIVAPIHAKAMPVILTTPEEMELWLNAPAETALQLQRPLPDDLLRIVP